MEIEPYSIYTDNRPFRIAFLVAPSDDITWVDRIVDYNRGKWGGRLNPIILTDGNTLDDPWWTFIRKYDPDIIYSTVPLCDELKKKIHIFLSPLRVEEVTTSTDRVRLNDNPLSIFPAARIVSQIGRDLFDEKSKLLLVQVDDSAPQHIKDFLSRNFGLFEGFDHITYSLKKSLEACEISEFNISDEGSLNEMLLELGQYHSSYVFLSQICAIPNILKAPEYNHKNERFEIIVGSGIDEITYFWNRSVAMQPWLRTRFTQLWLPKLLADSEDIKPGLGKFINKYVGSTGNDHSRGAHFVSFTETEEYLNSISTSFGSEIRYQKTSEKLEEQPFPQYRVGTSINLLKRGLDFHRANSNHEFLIIDEPRAEGGSLGGEKWFVDVCVQYRPERFKNIRGKEYWWQLPTRNSLVSDLQFFNKEARINEFGTFSILMARNTSIQPNETTLEVRIPEDDSVFRSLICGQKYDSYEPRGSRIGQISPFYSIDRSSEGMHLSGVLGLFDSLYEAHSLFEKRYWRRIFERMSNHNPGKDTKAENRILRRLSSKINSGVDYRTSVRAQESLANTVLTIAKEYSKKEVDLTYEEFEDAAKKETDEYNQAPSGYAIEFDEKDFKRSISGLVSKGILLIGVKPKCPLCGYKIWYQVDNLTKEILCKGCSYQYSLIAEPTWVYRLNSLIRAAVSTQGTIPVLLALGQSVVGVSSMGNSTLFIPSIDLLRKVLWSNIENLVGELQTRSEPFVRANSLIVETENNEIIKHVSSIFSSTRSDLINKLSKPTKPDPRELDLVFISDGKFVIGEVKTSLKQFNDNEFRKMSEIAKIIKPDLILFSSMSKKPNSFVLQKIEELKEELKDLEIDVQWFQLHHWAFTPSPVR